MTFGPDVQESNQSFCWTFSQKGHCYKGDACPWVHRTGERNPGADEATNVICNAWLKFGSCPRGDACRWAHPPINEVPVWVPVDMVHPQMMDMNLLGGGILVDMPPFGYTHPESLVCQPLLTAPPGTFSPCGVQGTALEEMTENTDAEKTNNTISPTWDQFAVNKAKFGVETTFLEDLTQYTTPLDLTKVPERIVQTADRIAYEIESERRQRGIGDGSQCVDCDQEYTTGDDIGDEEVRFSAVSRHAEHTVASGGINRTTFSSSDFVAQLRAKADTQENPLFVQLRRRLVDQNYCEEKAQSGHLLYCGFCRRNLGDVAEVVAHWTASLQSSTDAESASPCQVATRHLRGVAESQSFESFVAEHGIEEATTCVGSSTSQGVSKEVWKDLRHALASRRNSSSPDGATTITVAEAIDALRGSSQDRRHGPPEVVVGRHALLEAIVAAVGSYLFDPDQRDLCPSLMN